VLLAVSPQYFSWLLHFLLLSTFALIPVIRYNKTSHRGHAKTIWGLSSTNWKPGFTTTHLLLLRQIPLH
jgi:predicted outer membrane lipoprotein